MIGSLEWKFLLSILFLLYIVLLLPVIVKKLLQKLHIGNKLMFNVYLLLHTLKTCVQLILLSQWNLFLMSGSLEVILLYFRKHLEEENVDALLL